jgi:IgA Peptidase M64/Peptidase M64 N-terminus
MVRRLLTAFIPCAVFTSLAAGWQGPQFDFDRTMRVDYLHSGGPGGEMFSGDGVRVEGPWAGSRSQLVDRTDLGKYRFVVVDRASNRVIYSRGFASMYGEWETTPAFRTTVRTFHESIRFPWPGAPVRVAISKRDRQNRFEPLWEFEVDPDSVVQAGARNGSPEGMSTHLSMLIESGPPSRKVDLLLISEGYSSAEASKFRADAARLVRALFAHEPFKTRRSDFNVRALHAPGSHVSVEFNIFGLDRYALADDNRALRNVAAAAPYDVIEVLVNDKRYGGGGIFNQQSTVAASNAASEYMFIHELAHNLAGLGDEYVGTVTFETGALEKVEPWEPNITALQDPAALKWSDLVEPATPVPTPMSYAGKVGAFEGAGYESRGLYRPEASCIMGSRKTDKFCRVCQRAISRIIDLHTN